MFLLIFKIFIFSFLVNLFWEISHSILYTTCLKAALKEYVVLILRAALIDGIWITVFYLISFLIFQSDTILDNPGAIILYIILSLIFAFSLEKYSVKRKRWEYSKKMPRILGVGLTPLFQIAITGLFVFILIFEI